MPRMWHWAAWMTRLGPALSGLLPGLLLGILFAQQLFFLNPQLPFSVRSVAGAMALYGGSGACSSFLLLLLFSRGRRRQALRALPWGITLALVLAATLAWALPAFFGFYLAPGLNVRLAKAAAWITAFAVVCFYTALLHSIYRRRYGPSSRLCLVLCSLAAIATLLERRGAFLPPPPPPDQPTILASEGRPRLLVIGVDSASLEVVLPLAEQGQLPFFSHLLEVGSYGHLRSIRPVRSAPLWASVATGKLPYKHGVGGSRVFRVGWIDPRAEMRLAPPMWPFFDWARLGSSERLTDARDRRVLALWEILSRVNLSTVLVSWPASSPLDPTLSVGFSDRFFGAGSPDEAQPPLWAQQARLLRRLPDSLAETGAADWLRVALDRSQAGDAWRLRVATAIWQQPSPPAAMFLHLPGLRELSAELYGGFQAVQFEGLDRTPYREAFVALSAYYRWLDRELGNLVLLAPEPVLLAVVSAHGAEPASGLERVRAAVSDRRSVSGYVTRAPDGLLLLSGTGIRPGGRLDAMSLVDVAPTLLYGLGFPVARDFDGRVGRQAFDEEFLAHHPSTFIPSFDALKLADTHLNY